MKKATKYTILSSLAACGLATGQGLYDLASNSNPFNEMPMSWTVSVNVGYDDNATPVASEILDSEDTLYVSAFLRGRYGSATAQSSLEVWVSAGVIYYLDEIQQRNSSGVLISANDDIFPALSAGLNFRRAISERMNFTSRTVVAYELEPDYDYGLATDRRTGNHIRWSTTNSIGYEWTDRLGTETGVTFSGVNYPDISGSDYMSYGAYNQFRYRLSPSTVLTATGRYGVADTEYASNRNSVYATVGAEHSFSPNTVGVINVGAQIGDYTTPYVDLSLRTSVNEQFSIRGFLRYSQEDINRLVGLDNRDVYTSGVANSAVIFDKNETLRLGVQSSYNVSDRLTFYAGANYVLTNFSDPIASSYTGSGTAPNDFEDTLLHFNVGMGVKLTDTISLNASANHTTSASDADVRDYDRLRGQVGVSATF